MTRIPPTRSSSLTRRFCFHRTIALGCAVVAVLVVGFSVGLRGAVDPGAELKAGIAAFDAKRYPVAILTLKSLGPRLPKLADYAAWYLASSYSETKNFAPIPATLEVIWKQNPPSPFRAKAALLTAAAWLETSNPKAAIQVLRDHYAELSQPQGDMALADASLVAGEASTAAIYYQRVYYGYPQSSLAPKAHEQELALRNSLGANYPPSMPNAMLARAIKLADAKLTQAAISEFDALIPQLGGPEKDEARVRIGVAKYIANQNTEAFQYLSNLQVDTPEADAERLHYLVQSARRLERLNEMEQLALKSAELHPTSPWTIDSLVAAANRHLMDHNVERFLPLYTACYKGLPGDSRTDLCHWKVTWVHYMRRNKDAADMLRDHLRMYPASDSSSNALYFLGRLSEQVKDLGSARAFYEEASTQYPNVFYAMLSRDRLAQIGKGRSAELVREFLHTVAFPQRVRTRNFQADTAALVRADRAQLLSKAGLKDLAEAEMKYGADQGEQPHVLAVELGRLIGAGDPAQALKYIKRYAQGYLLMPIDSAPAEFWQLAFPLPYRASLEKYTKEHEIDPFLMAGLIRQESEFDAKVISYANARGLTQIEPATGREIGRRLKVAFSVPKLFEPDYNLRFGTYYFRLNLNQLNGNVEATLAAYNAGMTRAKQWLKWDTFREPAEFVETVPITQTRDYIQAVLRNAAAYREIYGEGPQAARSAP
ncbi:MAG: transglycosylase SLT domain-containing protein [Acidobacteriota bacterium]